MSRKDDILDMKALWAAASDVAKARWLAFEDVPEFKTSLLDSDSFEWTLKAMDHEFLTENSDQEAGSLEVQGFDDEDEAIDRMLERPKYGYWTLFRWIQASGRWEVAKIKRVGKDLVLEWAPHPYQGDEEAEGEDES